jgi:single-strand DNA-binding protein
MAGSLNRVSIIGRLGVDPELKYGASGKAFTRLSIATNERKKSGDEYIEVTEWHRVVLFGRQAEIAAEFLSSGRQVFIEGRLQTRSWEDGGVKKYMTEIVADKMVLIGNDGPEDRNDPERTSPPPTDEDLPF